MKNLKTFESFTTIDFINESLIGEIATIIGLIGGIPLAFILFSLNEKYRSYGRKYGREGYKEQAFPYKGIFKYIQMSKVLRKYKKQLKDFENDILERSPSIKDSISQLTHQFGSIGFEDQTSPTLWAGELVDEVLDVCTAEERILVQEIMKKFKREIDELFLSKDELRKKRDNIRDTSDFRSY